MTIQLLKQQNEYDQVLSGLLDQLERILRFADVVADKIVADKIVCEEMDILEDLIPRMYEVMHKVVEFSCDYNKHGRSSPPPLVPIIAAGMAATSAHQKTIKAIESGLMRVAKDFDRAVNVETLRQTKETGEHSFYPSLDRSFSAVPCRAAHFA